ncbi:transposase [Halomonas elongata]|uniref:transposase n=1 Tax=Halomonas elongata TaxID=2746 RepID=UPI0038D3BE4D
MAVLPTYRRESISILKANERGVSVVEMARQNGVTEQTIYRWKAKFSGMEVCFGGCLRLSKASNPKLRRSPHMTAIIGLRRDLRISRRPSSTKATASKSKMWPWGRQRGS